MKTSVSLCVSTDVFSHRIPAYTRFSPGRDITFLTLPTLPFRVHILGFRKTPDARADLPLGAERSPEWAGRSIFINLENLIRYLNLIHRDASLSSLKTPPHRLYLCVGALLLFAGTALAYFAWSRMELPPDMKDFLDRRYRNLVHENEVVPKAYVTTGMIILLKATAHG